ncbi:hypothetical protein CERSUDRAFT_112087 [Gelatoporia subvermispora B]|uniref:DUF6534 domain-containing protein n=1 Tax=Ceriporiopsis subvermispora (strain B) TaxID=914234 RepID=M2RLT5_CERS8|nr:hypothetical protein CERSUDRAFT_112087 [Gelatoporia subvermispora B]
MWVAFTQWSLVQLIFYILSGPHMNSSASQKSSIENTYGAYLIGVVISVALYGVTVLQTYIYFKKNEHDRKWLKRVVLLLWILDTMHKVTLCQSLYEFMVLDFGNPLAITSPTWSFWTSIQITSTMEIIVRCLLSYRLYALSKIRWIAVPIVLLSLCHFVVVLVYVVIEARHATVVTTNVTNPILYLAAASGCCSDISLATCQTIILRRLRSGFKATNKVVHTIVLYSVNTCVITCMVTVLCVVTYAVSLNGERLIWLSFYHQLGTLLFNALLATYNARQELREAVSGRGDLITIPLSDLPTSTGGMFAASNSSCNCQMQISTGRSTQRKVNSLPEDAFTDFKSATFKPEDVSPA